MILEYAHILIIKVKELVSMINTIMELNLTAFAKIKVNNKLSLKMFESCGFTKKYYILTKD